MNLPSRIPTIRHIVKIQLKDRPEGVTDVRSISLREEPIRVSDHGGGAKSGTISLGTSPSAGKGAEVDIKFWLAKTTTRNVSAGVRHVLLRRLRGNELVDLGANARRRVKAKSVPAKQIGSEIEEYTEQRCTNQSMIALKTKDESLVQVNR